MKDLEKQKYGMHRTRIDKVEIVSLIKVTKVFGEGDNNIDPVRQAYEYWTKDGEFIMLHDSYLQETEKK